MPLLSNFTVSRRLLLSSLCTPLLAHGQEHKNHADLRVRNRADWARRRAQVLDAMQQVMGPLRPPTPHIAHRMEEAEKTAKFTRYRLTYEPEPGDTVPAWLLVPTSAKQRHASVLCLHQTTKIGKDEPAGLGGKPNLHYARELAELGFVTFAPDYPNFGDYRIDVYAKGYASATMKGIVNHMAAVTVLQSLPFVDKNNIGVCGHSLGGHNALFVAAFDPRIKAAVTSCGFTAMPKYMKGDLTGWSHRGYMPRIAERYGKSAQQLPWDFPEVLGAIAPRGIFINAPKQDSNFEVSGVEDCVRAAAPLYKDVFRKPQHLQVRYPEAQHDFPPEVREEAYAFLRKML